MIALMIAVLSCALSLFVGMPCYLYAFYAAGKLLRREAYFDGVFTLLLTGIAIAFALPIGSIDAMVPAAYGFVALRRLK